MNAVLAPVLIPAQAIVTQFSLSCNYLLIRDWAYLDATSTSLLVLWSGGVLFLWTVVLSSGGYIQSQGRRTIVSWKYFNWPRAKKAELSRFRRSCKPLAIRAGGYFCIGKLTLLKFFRGIVRGTFRALLALK